MLGYSRLNGKGILKVKWLDRYTDTRLYYKCDCRQSVFLKVPQISNPILMFHNSHNSSCCTSVVSQNKPQEIQSQVVLGLTTYL